MSSHACGGLFGIWLYGASWWKVSLDEIKARNYNLDWKNPHTVEDNYGDPKELLEQLNAAEARTSSLRDQLKNMLAEALLR